MKVSLYHAIFLGPVVFNLVAFFAAWLYYENRRLWRARPAAAGSLYRCRACGHVYAAASDLPRLACPRCGQFNDAVKR